MTMILDLYGGPGTGKSTMCAEVFSILKKLGVECEQVIEYAKEWSVEQRPIKDFDQLYFYGHQVRREARLFDKFDVIITDSPVMLCGFYMRKYGKPEMHEHTDAMISTFYKMCNIHNHIHIPIGVTRLKEYKQNGRYETEEVSRRYDKEIREYVIKMTGLPLFEVTSSADILRIAVQNGLTLPVFSKMTEIENFV